MESQQNTHPLRRLFPCSSGTGCASLRLVIMAVSALFFLSVFNVCAAVRDTADSIYRGGPILTISDAMPRAEAVAVKDGRVLAVGTLSDVMSHRGEKTELFRPCLPGGWLVCGQCEATGARAGSWSSTDGSAGGADPASDLRPGTRPAQVRTRAAEAAAGFAAAA